MTTRDRPNFIPQRHLGGDTSTTSPAGRGAEPQAALALLDDRRILRIDPAGTMVLLGEEPGAVAIAGDGRDSYALLSRSLVRRNARGDTVYRLSLMDAPAVTVALSPDGSWDAVGHLDGQIALWDTSGPRLLATLSGHTQRISDLVFDARGQTLASGSWDGDLRLWKLGTLEVEGATLATALEAAWGRSLSDLFATTHP